uniref:SAND domain-containing protein n=1 Tax=Erpetoichthys calabaricus TaxID=27687 RepID=A0A8C4T2I1_ERPCA
RNYYGKRKVCNNSIVQAYIQYSNGYKTREGYRFLFTGEDCIFTEGKWYSPGEFEAYGGRSSSKNWKISIRCNNVPLIKLIECPIAKLKKFPVTCGSAEGVLHKHRFATGTCGKCIRTEQGWFTPTDFLKLDDTVSDKSWRRSIQFNGKQYCTSLRLGILEPHSLICHCRICKSVDQDNDDECGICSQAGSLVCCDQCPRAFHPECHVPSAEKEAEEVSPRSVWFLLSLFTKLFAIQCYVQIILRAVVFNFPVQDHLLVSPLVLVILFISRF